MKPKAIAAILIFFASGFLFAGNQPDLEKEKEAIIQATMDYIEGWFEGNGDRMNRALHVKLAKRRVAQHPQSGQEFVVDLDKEKMVTGTKNGGGKHIPKDKRGIKVTVLDVYRNIASVKTECLLFVDYLHLVKSGGQWKIINVLWENIIKEHKLAKVNPAIYKDYVGEYELRPGFIMTVTEEDNRIFLQATRQPKMEIFPESEVKFFLKVTEAQVTFVKDDQGKVVKLILHQMGRDMDAKKIK